MRVFLRKNPFSMTPALHLPLKAIFKQSQQETESDCGIFFNFMNIFSVFFPIAVEQ
jgi:hypothetical protein